MLNSILIVEDQRDLAELAALHLADIAQQVRICGDGREALSVLAGRKVDVIITDLNMPVMDGLTLIRELRASPTHRSVPILMLTTEADGAKKADGKAAGATGWIVKPFSPEKLVAVVKQVAG